MPVVAAVRHAGWWLRWQGRMGPWRVAGLAALACWVEAVGPVASTIRRATSDSRARSAGADCNVTG